MSAPERTPLSRTIGMRPATASAMPGSASMVAIAPSTWRPPWFDTTIPLIPCSIAASASAGWRIPFSRIGSSGPLAEEREVVPGERRTRVRLDEAPHRCAREPGAHVREPRARVGAGLTEERRDRRKRDPTTRRRVLAERFLQRLHEHGITRVLGDALPLQERQRAEVEVADPPAEHRRVEREDDRGAAAALCPRDEALDELVRRAPVELEPARGVSHRAGGLLHRAGRLVGEDERDAFGRSGPRHRDVRIAVRHLQHADGAQDEGARQRRSEDVDGRLSGRNVAKHSRDDSPALERGAVLAHRPFGPRAARDVCVALGGHALACCGFEPLDGDGDGRIRPACAPDIDLELPLASDSDGHACTLTGSARESRHVELPGGEARARLVALGLPADRPRSGLRLPLRRDGGRHAACAHAIAAHGSTARRVSLAVASSTS